MISRRRFTVAALGASARPLAAQVQPARKVYRIGMLGVGARPAEMAVEQPTAFKLTLNPKTAGTLDPTIPQSLLLRTEEVIQ